MRIHKQEKHHSHTQLRARHNTPPSPLQAAGPDISYKERTTIHPLGFQNSLTILTLGTIIVIIIIIVFFIFIIAAFVVHSIGRRGKGGGSSCRCGAWRSWRRARCLGQEFHGPQQTRGQEPWENRARGIIAIREQKPLMDVRVLIQLVVK